jgi:predicted PurR-regulated permease PerM
MPFETRAQTVTRTGIAIVVVLLAGWVALDLLAALAWAIVIAIAEWPV